MALDVDGGLEGGGVLLEGPGREADVADLGREHPPEVLPVEEPLDLALAVLGEVERRWSSKNRITHRLRVALDQADGEAARPTRAGGRGTG